MRHLALLALLALVAIPLSAHDHGWRGPRQGVIVEEACRPSRRWDQSHWNRGHHGWHRGYDRDDDRCDDRVILRPLRPLAPPFRGRVELWFR